MTETLFDKIINNEIENWKVWESKTHLAFLTPFPNTLGLTIVIPKKNIGDYVFSLEQKDYQELLDATKEVAKVLEKAFETTRVAMIFEGTGVAHVHAKLYPLHGELANATDVWSHHQEFYPEYLGYLSTVEGPKMPKEKLDEIQKKILKVQENIV
ncbi:HIT domain-containing protein [candidate division WWE3 bacterium]|nr:HIT domain-containing protein [candidate division WWE3 bacterium]